MAEWEEKLQSILGNPEAMGQIMSIAQSLGGAGAREQPSAPPPQQETGQMPEQQAGMNKMMLYFMPLFSVWICATGNAAFAVYWLVSNLYMTVLNFAVNLYYKKKEEKNPVLIR